MYIVGGSLRRRIVHTDVVGMRLIAAPAPLTQERARMVVRDTFQRHTEVSDVDSARSAD